METSMESVITEANIDLADLPLDIDDERRVHRRQTEKETWSSADEEEKAVSDRHSSATQNRAIFSSVYGLSISCKAVMVPRQYQPTKSSSPSVSLQKNKLILENSICATMRMSVKFTDKIGATKTHFSTTFSASPIHIIGCRHAMDKEKIIAVKVCRGRTISSYDLEDDSDAFEVNLVCISSQKASTETDINGLFTGGADFAILRSSRELHTFLLPCSPSYVEFSELKRVAMLSYPAVDDFLEDAKDELVIGKVGTIWNQYLPMMGKMIKQEEDILKNKQKWSSEVDKHIDPEFLDLIKDMKLNLYSGLLDVFGRFITGTMVCSVGAVLILSKVCMGTSCSTLRGSSGAAVCCLKVPGHFIGIHRGGAVGFDVNIATSVDNQLFVKAYIEHVLPLLPPPDHESWSKRDSFGFHYWLHKHISHLEESCPWYTVASRGTKRQGP